MKESANMTPQLEDALLVVRIATAVWRFVRTVWADLRPRQRKKR
jgi:hypothetical protein